MLGYLTPHGAPLLSDIEENPEFPSSDPEVLLEQRRLRRRAEYKARYENRCGPKGPHYSNLLQSKWKGTPGNSTPQFGVGSEVIKWPPGEE